MAMFKFKVRSPVWLEFRKKYVTATEMASLFGLNTYTSINKVKEEKVNPQTEPLRNKYLRDGIILEPSVVAALKYDLGMNISFPCEGDYALVFTDEYSRISSTPDAFYWDEQKPAVVECKSTDISIFRKNWKGQTPPLRYLMQVHTQMYTTGLSQGYLACISKVTNIPLSVYEIKENPEIYILMLKETQKFWKNFNKKKLPTPDNETREKMAELLKKSVKFLGVYQFPDASTEDEELTIEDLFKN